MQDAQEVFGVDFDFDEFDQYGEDYDDADDDDDLDEVRYAPAAHLQCVGDWV